jgi:hypothetical protein
MRTKWAFAALAALFVIALSPQALAQAGGISMTIEKHAVFTEQAAVVIRIHITCGPFAGIEEFQEGLAGGGQAKTGAAAETGIDGTVVCDGVERIHTAHLTSFTGAAFEHGPASVSALLTVCMLVGEEQMCFSGAMSRRVIVRGGSFR